MNSDVPEAPGSGMGNSRGPIAGVAGQSMAARVGRSTRPSLGKEIGVIRQPVLSWPRCALRAASAVALSWQSSGRPSRRAAGLFMSAAGLLLLLQWGCSAQPGANTGTTHIHYVHHMYINTCRYLIYVSDALKVPRQTLQFPSHHNTYSFAFCATNQYIFKNC